MAIAASCLTGVATSREASAADPSNEEIITLLKYIQAAPKLPRGTVKSKIDIEEIKMQIVLMGTTSDISPFLSSASNAMLSEVPSLAEEMSGPSDPNTKIKSEKFKIYKGKNFASYSFKTKDPTSKKWEKIELIFVKENGTWKVDLVQTMGVMFKKLLKSKK